MKAYRLIDPDTHDLFFQTHVQFDERLPTSPSSSPSLVLPDSRDTSSEILHGEDIPEVVAPTSSIDPPPSSPPVVAPSPPPPNVASSSTDGRRMPQWAHSTLEDAAPFIKDLPPRRHSTGSSLVGQAHSGDPETFSKAHGLSEWDDAMAVEYSSLMKNDTWELVPLPHGRKLVRCKWVYRTKYAADGSIDKYKASLVAKGFSQVEGIDYSETFAPVAKMDSIRLVLALATAQGWSVFQMDVKSAFFAW